MDHGMNERVNQERKRAVALQYEPGSQRAPVVVAAGSGHMAEKIIAAAKENGIPLQEEPEPLVRGHAAWALGRIGTPAARQVLEAAARQETDAAVRQEIQSSLETS